MKIRKQPAGRKKHRYRWKYIAGTKGVISLFLALLMVPFTTMAGILINAARVNSAVAIFDEALCNASNSTLGTYDKFLRKRFGLLAVSQQAEAGGGKASYTPSNFISETFQVYMEENMKALSNTYLTSDIDSRGIYPLADSNVLAYQTMEYGKYNVTVKLAEDAIDLDGLVSKLEGALPGNNWFDVITDGIGMADSLDVLALDFEKLKKTVEAQWETVKQYENAYKEFENQVNAYNVAGATMLQELANLQAVMEAEKKKEDVGAAIKEIEELEQEIAILREEQKKPGVDHTAKITEKEDNVKKLKSDNKELVKTYFEARNDYAKKLGEYQTTLSRQKTQVDTARLDYAKEAAALAETMPVVQEKIQAVKNDLTSIGSAAAGLTTEAAQASVNEEINKNQKQIEKLKAQRSKETDIEKQAATDADIQSLEQTNTSLKNRKQSTKAFGESWKALAESVGKSIVDYDSSVYSVVEKQLADAAEDVKRDSFSEGTSQPSQYYISLWGLLTNEDILNAEGEMLDKCMQKSALGIIRGLLAFIEALFKITGFVDERLNARIDTNYYNKAYGGLPSSEKKRKTHPLAYGEKGDAEQSEYYRKLFGDYAGADADAPGTIDIAEKCCKIFEDVQTINVYFSGAAIQKIARLIDFTNTFKVIAAAVKRIIKVVKDIVKYFQQALKHIGRKVLLSGYALYMTSNRVTYGGKALTGVSFNMREQPAVHPLEKQMADTFLAVPQMMQQENGGDLQKCFVGAEQEYLLFGEASEVENQRAVFRIIYLVRMILDFFPICSDPEVATIAASSTIFAPVVYALYAILEPMVDALAIVNGESVPIIKTFAYLTPSGVSAMYGKFSKLTPDKKQLDQMKTGLLESWQCEEYLKYQETFGFSEDSTETQHDYLKMDYQKTMFLLLTLFVSRDKLLARLGDIIEMESVEYLKNVKKISDPRFDLDYSYTYIRTEAKFSMNEFMRLSESGGFNAKKRIVYRGY